MRLLVLFTLLVCSASGCNNSPISEAGKKEIEQLQGVWQVERLEYEGTKLPATELAKMSFILKGADLIPNDEPNDILRIELDPTQKPAWINTIDRDNQKQMGIYRVDGNRWDICLADVKAVARPKEFKSTSSNAASLLILRRQSK